MKRHPFDLTSFIFGVVFGGAATAYLLAEQFAWDVDARWVLPVALMVLGIAGIGGAVAGLRANSPASDELDDESGSEGLVADSVS